MSDVYRGRIRIQLFAAAEAPAAWNHAVIEAGFITLGTSYMPNQHFELFPEAALELGSDAFAPEDPRTSEHILVGEKITCPRELKRCKSTRFGRIACTRERDIVLMDTLDEDVLAGWLCDYDDLSEE